MEVSAWSCLECSTVTEWQRKECKAGGHAVRKIKVIALPRLHVGGGCRRPGRLQGTRARSLESTGAVGPPPPSPGHQALLCLHGLLPPRNDHKQEAA